MKSCPLCQDPAFVTIYNVTNLPVFQNKVYPTEEEAKGAITGDIILVQCQHCGFVFNIEFNDELMQYDEKYENVQTHSDYFRLYLEEIIDLLKSEDFLSGKIVEIGCGKGYFLEQLLQNGFDVVGFDPAYEGNNPRIIKDYFGESYRGINADAIILRHTLEHIKDPFRFLHSIAKANDYRGKIFIEVPCFDWIKMKRAFWDIFYEHCNYFSLHTLQAMFSRSSTGRVFGDQYLYIFAELSCLNRVVPKATSAILLTDILFTQECERYKKFVDDNKGLMVWGAAAKGATFVNLIDPEKLFIDGLIDVNPKKQNRYIAKTGHKIYGTEVIKFREARNVLIMNENYVDEIEKMVSIEKVNLYILGLI